MSDKYTDTERLDFLQSFLGLFTGKVICRWSTRGHGWRLHESSQDGSSTDVREAIDLFIEENKTGE